jgi:glycosyltransferase involved in cell wall biosynthesis
MLKLSIITINYNNLEGLKKTLESVVNQTWQEFEYIVIDGGSTDGSAAYIESQSEYFDYWVSEKDSGIYNAMNKGIVKATGEYLLFLNTGDILNNNFAIKDFFSHPNFFGDIIYGNYKFEEGGKVYPDHLTPLFFVRSSLPHQSTFFKKEVFEKMGLYEEKYKVVSDRAFYIKCFLSNQFIFTHINYPLTVFDLSGISNDAKYQQTKIKEDEQMFQEYYGIYYGDYKKMISLQSELNQVKRKTIEIVGKRIINRFMKICRIR